MKKLFYSVHKQAAIVLMGEGRGREEEEEDDGDADNGEKNDEIDE